MARMTKALRLLPLLLLGVPALGQSTDSHTITVQVPQVLRLTVDATDVLFDFANSSASGTFDGLPVAGEANYLAFLEAGGPTQDFAPTAWTDTDGNGFATAAILSNRAQWTLSVALSGNLAAPLDNARLKVKAVKLSGKGTAQTTDYTSMSSTVTLAQATSGGQGKSVYAIYYALTMDINDDFTQGYSAIVTAQYTLASP